MLKRLALENFRNYENYALDFSLTNILVGPNGIGKTNLLEAIFLLSTGRSWRTFREGDLIFFEKELAKISAKTTNEKELLLEMIIQRQKSPEYPQVKIIKINGLRKRLVNLLGQMPVVLFSPEEIELVEGSPSRRRRFLDILLCQIDKKYTLVLGDLIKIIRGRNKLLYFIKINRSETKELAFWNEKLVTLGSFIIKKREKIFEAINEQLSTIYQSITGNKENLKLKYRQSVKPENFAITLSQNQTQEIERTATLYGPHRDDFVFLLDERNLASFGSRGEYRSAVLTLKMAELIILEKEINKKPILLLDDIFSELDDNRRKHLAKIIGENQTIITTTDLAHLEGDLRKKAKIIELSNIF